MKRRGRPALRRWLERWMGGDDWGMEFLESVDAEVDRRCPRGGSRAWWVTTGRLLSPGALTFYGLLVRRRVERRRSRKRRTMGGRGDGMLDGWWGDTRIALRTLARERRFAVFGTATLALGIAGVATMYGITDRLFIRGPSHLEEPDRLARLYLRIDDDPGPRTTAWIPWLTLRGMAEGDTGFESLAGYRHSQEPADLPDGARRVHMTRVDASYFDVLGAEPALGRWPDPADPDDADAVVLSHETWRSAYEGRADALGARFELAGTPVTVVGVAPEGFSGPDLSRVDLWRPLDPELVDNVNWWVVGRLSATESLAAARTAAAERAEAIHAVTDPGRFFGWAREGRIVARPLGYDDAGEEPAEADVARLLSAVCLLVLLLACVNVVNLAFARMTRRTREIGVRRALGVGRARLFRSLITETLLLGGLAALAALPLAWFAGRALRTLLFPGIAWAETPLDPSVLAATGVAATVAALGVGIVPALAASRMELRQALGTGGSSRGRRLGRLHGVLATGQVTLAVTLLLAAGLLLRSFWSLRTTDLGFDPEVVAVTLGSVSPDRVRPGSEAEDEAYRTGLELMRLDPSVEAAAVVVGAPFLTGFSVALDVPGWDSIPALPGGGPWYAAVSPGYFRTMGTPILRGRAFVEGDAEVPVVVVSASMAETLWPRGGALGACIGIGNSEAGCHRVVGVAADVHRSGYREPPSMQFYVPLEQVWGVAGSTLVVRTRKGADPGALRTRLREVGGEVDLVELATLGSFLEPEVRPWRLGAVALAVAAGLATVVALLGVYGVVAYLVAQRVREIGVRMALGATTGSIQTLVLRTGMTSAVVGLGAGLVLLLAGVRWLDPLLYRTRPLEPTVVAVVAGLVATVTLAACALPARQASRIAPAEVLRGE